MNLGFGGSNGSHPPAWIDSTEFAEVVYGSNHVLVVSVATDLAEDTLLTNALIDVIATSERFDVAESAIATLAASLDLDVWTGNGHGPGERHLTIVPAPQIEAEAAPPIEAQVEALVDAGAAVAPGSPLA